MKLVLATCLALLAACPSRSQKPLPHALATVPPERTPIAATTCPFMATCWATQCGYNSSHLTGFDVGGLDLDGCRNIDGVRIVPRSLVAPRCGAAPMWLDLDDGRLIGRSVGGTPVRCAGAQLVGATFWLEGPADQLQGLPPAARRLPHAQTVRQELRFRAVGEVAPYAPGPPLSTVTIERTGRALTLSDSTSTDPDAWLDVSGHAVSDTCQLPGRETLADAVAVAGELYDREANVVTIGEGADRWVHFACLHSALAESRLLGNDPLAASSSAAVRQSTLKMLTARYCSALKPGSFTVPGVALAHWQRSGADARPTDPRIGPIEAHWGKDGARCISHSRLWRRFQEVPLASVPALADCCDSEENFVHTMQQVCGIEACTSEAAGPDVYWTTFTMDHVKHLLIEPEIVPPHP